MKKLHLLLLFVLAIATSAIAGPITSAGSANWNSTIPNAPWPGGIVPSSTDDVSIRSGDNITVTANASITSITFLGTSAATSTLTVDSGIVLTISTNIAIANAIANNTAAAVKGAGTIHCASLKLGGAVTTGFSLDRTTSFTSNIALLNIGANLVVRSEDEVSNQCNSIFTHTSGTISVKGSVVIDAENDGQGTGPGSATYTMNGGGIETGILDIAGITPFSTPGGGTVIFDANGTRNTVVYSGDNQIVRATPYRHLTLSGSGTKTITGVGTVNGNMTLGGTTDITTAANFFIGGNLNIGSGSTLTIGGFDFIVNKNTTVNGILISRSLAGFKSFDNFIVNAKGKFHSTVDEDYAMTGDMQIDALSDFVSGLGMWTWSATGAFSGKATIANITINASGSFSFTNNGQLTVSTLSGSDGFIQGHDAVLNFSGSSMSHNGVFTATAAGNTINYTGSAQTITPTAYQNLILSGTNIKTLGGNITINTMLSMRGTAALSTVDFGFNYANNCTLEYAGFGPQTTSDIEFKGSGGPSNLKINNPDGVELHAARIVPGTITFSKGILKTTSSKLLIIGATGNVAGASDASFVDGPVKKIGAISGSGFSFPVGKKGVGYMKIRIANVTGVASEFTAEYFRANAAAMLDTIGLSAIGLQDVSNCEYWTIDRSVTTSPADVTLSWNSHSPCSRYYLVEPLFDIRIARFNGSTWDGHGGGDPSGNASSGSITWSGVSSFNSFSLAALAGSQNFSSVMFYNVKAFEKNRGVQIEWDNLTERDLSRYVVQRSSDGQNFKTVTEQYPKGNHNDKESYSAFDASPFSGANYYRIKVYDISGRIIYSKVMRVDFGKTLQGFSLYPNPVKGNQVSVSMKVKQGQYGVKVLNTAGQEVYSLKLNHPGGAMTQTLDIPCNIKPGVYNMMISGDNYREAKIFVIQ